MIQPYMTLKVGTLQAKRRQWSRVVGRSHWSKSQDEESNSPHTHQPGICPWNETLNSQRRFRRRSPKEGAPPPFYCSSSILWWLPLIFGSSMLTFLHDSSNHHLPISLPVASPPAPLQEEEELVASLVATSNGMSFLVFPFKIQIISKSKST